MAKTGLSRGTYPNPTLRSWLHDDGTWEERRRKRQFKIVNDAIERGDVGARIGMKHYGFISAYWYLMASQETRDEALTFINMMEGEIQDDLWRDAFHDEMVAVAGGR